MLIAVLRITIKALFVNEDCLLVAFFGIRYKVQSTSLLSLPMVKTGKNSEKDSSRIPETVFYFFWLESG